MPSHQNKMGQAIEVRKGMESSVPVMASVVRIKFFAGLVLSVSLCDIQPLTMSLKAFMSHCLPQRKHIAC